MERGGERGKEERRKGGRKELTFVAGHWSPIRVYRLGELHRERRV